ncbi:MAG: hypothetical protein RIG66_10110, partial [Coleofasciculus sp. E2-BRE-01]
VRQRLKEWYQDSKGKKGEKRRELDVSQCFAPLLKWILSLWKSEDKCLKNLVSYGNSNTLDSNCRE